MEDTPPDNKATGTPASSRARWIVYATLACWIIFFVVMAVWIKNSPDPDDRDTSFVEGLMAFAAIPSLPAVFLGIVAPVTFSYCFTAASGITFAGLEFFAWKRRSTKLAVALLAWLLLNISVIAALAIFYKPEDGC